MKSAILSLFAAGTANANFLQFPDVIKDQILAVDTGSANATNS